MKTNALLCTHFITSADLIYLLHWGIQEIEKTNYPQCGI